MRRKIFRWVILSESEYRELLSYKEAFKPLNKMAIDLIDMVIDLLRSTE